MWRKAPFKLQDRSMGFNGTEYEEFTDTVSESTSCLILKKIPLI